MERMVYFIRELKMIKCLTINKLKHALERVSHCEHREVERGLYLVQYMS